MFGNVIAVAFQIIINNGFLFLKNYFYHQYIKTIQNILNFSKKNFEFFGIFMCFSKVFLN
jgi:hypothetical protein